VFFLVFGWQRRGTRLGFVGPFTCPTCSWMGTFWLDASQHRFRLYFIPVMPWRTQRYACVCRNCGNSTYVAAKDGADLVASVSPLTAPDPLGPAQSQPAGAPFPGR
jgi:zinc ribbon protein